MPFVLMFNKIEEQLVAPHLVFAHIFQLKGYGKYGMHGNVVNLPSNFDFVKNVLPWMPFDNSSIRKLEYKSILCENMFILM